MILGKGHAGEHIGFGLVHKGGELGQFRTQLTGGLVPLGLGGLRMILGESGGDESGHDAPSALAGISERVAH